MNYGFLDLEMSCDGHISGDRFVDDGRMAFKNREIISAGFIISDDKYHRKNQYYALIKPAINSNITDYCSKLTGLEQSEVDSGKKCNNAFGDIWRMCLKYSVDYIFTYGTGDANIISITAARYGKLGEKVHHLYWVKNKIVDVESAIKKGIGKRGRNSLSMESVRQKLHIDSNGRHHNALDDATLLFNICRELDIQMVDCK